MNWTVLFLLAQLTQGALALTCLRCNGISQPRHCKFVEECQSGQVCGVEKVVNSYGAVVYNVGCITHLLCRNTSSRSYKEVCRECCNGDLCNAQGCGEPGYPQNRGPVCLSCSLQKDYSSCHTLEFCDPGDVCQHSVVQEFGDTLYSIGCSSLLSCQHSYPQDTSIFGRDVSSVQEQSDIAQRSMTKQVCSNCCDTDVCNKDCNGTARASDHCSSSPCQHGRCENSVNGYSCICDSMYTGATCDLFMGKCYNNPCVHGKCYENKDEYVCICDTGYDGPLCDNMTTSCPSGLCNGTTNVTDDCASSPCVHGRCENTVSGYTCQCYQTYTGNNCETNTKTSQCVDKTVNTTCQLAQSIVCQDESHAQNGGCMHFCGFC